MKKTIFIVIIFLFSFVAVTLAETAIKAEVDKAKITTDETLTYKIIVTSSDKKIPSPELPKFAGFNTISQAQSSTLSFMKSNIQTILVYAFILSPLEVGKFRIEPSTLKVKGKTYSTEAFEIEVVQGKFKPKPEQKQESSLPEEPQPESGQPQITL